MTLPSYSQDERLERALLECNEQPGFGVYCVQLGNADVVGEGCRCCCCDKYKGQCAWLTDLIEVAAVEEERAIKGPRAPNLESQCYVSKPRSHARLPPMKANV